MEPTRRDIEVLRQRRHRAARFFEKGLRQAEVAHRLGVSRQSVLRWHVSWRKGGTRALHGAGRLGRRPRILGQALARVETALRQGPQAHGYATELWTLPRIGVVIQRVTGEHYHPGHVWRLMRQLGWSLQRPTQRAREQDPKAVKRWIRQTWPGLKKTPHADVP